MHMHMHTGPTYRLGGPAVNKGAPQAHRILTERKNVVAKHDDLVAPLLAMKPDQVLARLCRRHRSTMSNAYPQHGATQQQDKTQAHTTQHKVQILYT